MTDNPDLLSALQQSIERARSDRREPARALRDNLQAAGLTGPHAAALVEAYRVAVREHADLEHEAEVAQLREQLARTETAADEGLLATAQARLFAADLARERDEARGTLADWWEFLSEQAGQLRAELAGVRGDLERARADVEFWRLKFTDSQDRLARIERLHAVACRECASDQGPLTGHSSSPCATLRIATGDS